MGDILGTLEIEEGVDMAVVEVRLSLLALINGAHTFQRMGLKQCIADIGALMGVEGEYRSRLVARACVLSKRWAV